MIYPLKSPQYRLSDNYSDVYTKKGITNTSSDKTNLFAVLLDEGKIADYESKSSSNPKLPSNSIIVVKKGDYTWNSSEEGGIIVATGNVKLEKNFKGLIIAGGDIEFSGATKVVADSDRLERFLITTQLFTICLVSISARRSHHLLPKMIAAEITVFAMRTGRRIKIGGDGDAKR